MGKFTGLQNGKYTPQYTESVTNVIGSPNELNKAITELAPYGVKSKEDLERLAYDKTVGPVHNYFTSQPKIIPIHNDSVMTKQGPSNTASFYEQVKPIIDKRLQG